MLLRLQAGAVLLALAGGAVAEAQFDSLTSRKGTPTLGTIVSMTRKSVTLDTRTGKREIPVNQVRKLKLADEPSGLTKARDALLRDQFEEA